MNLTRGVYDMNGKQYDSLGTDVELADAMLDNIEELLVQIEESSMSAEKKEDAISKLKFTRKFISGFAAQL
jgi:hypothetical protein